MANTKQEKEENNFITVFNEVVQLMEQWDRQPNPKLLGKVVALLNIAKDLEKETNRQLKVINYLEGQLSSFKGLKDQLQSDLTTEQENLTTMYKAVTGDWNNFKYTMGPSLVQPAKSIRDKIKETKHTLGKLKEIEEWISKLSEELAK